MRKQKSRIKESSRVILSTAATAAAVLTLTQCGPITPSVSKHGSFSKGTAGASEESGKSSNLAPEVKTFRYKTEIIAAEEYNGRVDRAKPVAKVEFDAAQVRSMRFSKSVELELGAKLPADSAAIVFEVAVTRDTVSTDQLYLFDVELKQKEGSKWILSVAKNVDKEIAKKVIDRMANAVILFGDTSTAGSGN